MKITVEKALQVLKGAPETFAQLFRHGTMSVEIYQPREVDLQQPHLQDEIYVIISGSGIFQLGAEQFPFSAGDLLFVPAGVEHRFVQFSQDFSTWVIFYGAAGGEAKAE
jgi:mannose-6-phosphate isomerase-like protein (cupin superfamily)